MKTNEKLFLKNVEKKLNHLHFRWTRIQGALADHRAKLATALEVHAFNRDIDDLNERINEKVRFLFQMLDLNIIACVFGCQINASHFTCGCTI